MSEPQRPKIVHLIDQPEGGAAVAAKRLAQSLSSAQIQAEIWVFGRVPHTGAGSNITFLEQKCRPRFYERLIKNFSKGWAQLVRRKRQRELLLSALQEKQPDVLHLHNLHASALQHEDLALIPPSINLAWTMHDCWPWAPWAYRWKDEAGADEIQGADRRPAHEGLAARRQFFAKRKGTILVSPSNWLAREAQRNETQDVHVTVIPNGVSCEVFNPVPKLQARAAIGLNPTKVWLGLSAASFDRRKGADILMAALEILRRNNIGVVLWGNCKGMNVPESVELFTAGYVKDEKHQALLYSACDLFVCPSRIDNLPNTILESMACETPVVASNIGGIPDMVRPGHTGWLFTPNTPHACADALNQALHDREKWAAYGERCRKIVEGEYSIALQASRYTSLYLNMICRSKL